jgi:hypothetical protein
MKARRTRVGTWGSAELGRELELLANVFRQVAVPLSF